VRELKFRAWDKEESKLSTPFGFRDLKAYDGETQSIWFDTDDDMTIEVGSDLGYGDYDKKESDKLLSQYIIEQFIGLHDKNNKDWFVEDIGEFDNGDRFVIKQEDYLEIYIQWIGEPECGDQARDLYRIEKAVCIGNTHENSYLLYVTE
jgi:hypothetical protein